MDNIIQKFYSTGKDEPPHYSQFSAFSSNMIQNPSTLTSFNIKRICDIKPPYKPIKPKAETLKYKPYTPLKPRGMTQDEFLRKRNLMFNGSSDMLFDNLRYNPRGEIDLMKENLTLMNKKNVTKIQMIEEKMKNLELKNQRLEVINDFFFDMFENNLAKDKIQKQRELKALEEEKKLINEDSSDFLYSNDTNDKNEKYYKKKRKKFRKSRSDININRYGGFKRKKEFDPIEFQQRTAMNAREVLNNIKRNLGTYLVEDELKKNEQFQIINEDINELKTDLNNKLDKIQKNQNHQMQKIYYCLLNSGDKNVESVAWRLFNDFSGNNNKVLNNFQDKESNKSSKLGESFRKSARSNNDYFFN